MAKTANINVRINPETKAGAENFLPVLVLQLLMQSIFFCVNLSWKEVCLLK